MAEPGEGVLHSINVSNGGVPKYPCESTAVNVNGPEGDRQRDLENHGGPQRAVSLYSLEPCMTPGSRVQVGGVSLELTRYAAPCTKIARAFRDGRVVRVSQKVHAGWSRLYARVLKEGTLRIGDQVRILP